jgi:hypothetical protein
MYRWCVTDCWRNIVWLWERELVSGKYVVEATRRVAGGVHLRPPIDVSSQARTPHMGSLDTAPHRLLRLVLHKLTIEFDQLDDHRAVFQIISNQLATGVMPFDTVANLFRDSLGYIDDWHDITTSSLLPDAASLPSIV